MPNRLEDETSPYLLQHAHNPVDWYPWGDEALQRAVAENKPILLSIGYSACHWCHVMEQESFEDPAIAAMMNEHFVNIKVDREERPDLDELYMRAVQAFNHGQGGWPMTVFLTPTGHPYFGGTYYPPVRKHKLPAFPDVLQQMATMYSESRTDVDGIVEQVSALLKRTGDLGSAAILAPSWLSPVCTEALAQYDADNGGFSPAPKFPAHGTLEVLLARAPDDVNAERAALDTLDAMATGGMYDLLGGGFHRYSVDDEWRIPHFEKMLSDNAQLVPIYCDAYRLTGAARYRRVVAETLGWIEREMMAPDGGFATSLDADSEGGEGFFYSWTPEELDEILEDDGFEAGAMLSVSSEGTFEAGRSVLRLAMPRADLNPGQRARLDESLKKLLVAREERAPPARDGKVVLAWNALAVRAFARAAAVFSEPKWAARAESALLFLLEDCRVNGRLMRTFQRGRARIPAFADDYANLLHAVLEVHQTTFENRWLDVAVTLADQMLALFWDPEKGGLFYVGNDQPELVSRSKHPVGSSEPGANGVAAKCLVMLSNLLGREDYGRCADQILRGLQKWLTSSPLALGAEAIAGEWWASGGKQVAVIGDPKDASTKRLLEVVRSRPLPMGVLVASKEPDAQRFPWLEGKQAGRSGEARVFVCEGHTCSLPTSDPAEVLELLAKSSAGEKRNVTVRVPAPRLPTSPESWLGVAEPLALDQLRGQVVVLDFFTYSCVNCLHMLPQLAELEAEFAGQPVAVLGVHSPRFDAEKSRDGVARALRRHNVRHPVVLDSDHSVWAAYAVRQWPTVVVLDVDGRIAWVQEGEVGADEVAVEVRRLLSEGEAAGVLDGDMRAVVTEEVEIERRELAYPGKVSAWPVALDQELGEAFFGSGRLYVSDTAHHQILELAVEMGDDGWPVAHELRRIGSGKPGLVDGSVSEACFQKPQGTSRSGDTLFVADTGNHAIRAVDLSTGEVTTLAGTGKLGPIKPDRVALDKPLEVSLRSPWDVEVYELRGELMVFIAMAGSHQLWVYGLGHLGIYAGSGEEDHVDGPAMHAALAQPSGLACFGRYMLFADSEVSSIRGLDLQRHQLVTVVGQGLFDFGDVDGRGAQVRMQHPLDLTFIEDSVYVADTFNHKIKRVHLATTSVRTVAGGDDSLCEPGGIDRLGPYLVIADTNHHRIVAMDPKTGEQRELIS